MAFKFAYFVELTKGYQPVKFQFRQEKISWFRRLSESGFKEELQKHNDGVIMTSFHNFGTQIFNIL